MSRRLIVRSEQPPDDATIVVRAGIMGTERIRRAAERSFELYAVYGISVEAVLDTSVQRACRSDRIVGYRQVRLSTAGRVREAGFSLLATFDRPHFTLVLPDLSELSVVRLDRCFDDPIPNPGRSLPQ